jgi:hypothetical protein
MLRKLLSRLPISWIYYVKFLLGPDRFFLLPKKKVQYGTDHLYTYVRADFREEPRFAAAYRVAEQYGKSLMPPGGMQWRVFTLCWAADLVKHLPGDFVACGVYTGFCDRAVMEYVDFQKLGKTYVLMDTFEGLDPRYSTPDELAKQTRYKTAPSTYDTVRETFRDFPVRIVKGSIPDTLPEAGSEAVCFLSIDMNTAAPERAALEFFWPRLVPGGVVVFDDYGFGGHEAQKATHDEFARRQGLTIFALPTGQGLLFKPAKG